MNEAVVHVVYDRCHIDLNMPVALQKMSLSNLAKVWTVQCKQPWNNAESITEMERWIHTVIETAKADWNARSHDYQNLYKSTQCDYLSTKEQKRKIENNNKKLLQAVKSAKSRYERSEKLLTKFTEIKQKYE